MSDEITEGIRSVATVLENTGDGRNFIFEAVVSEADFLNRNRRVYPEHVLFPAFDAYNQAVLSRSAAPGLVDHPDWSSPASVSDIGINWLGFRFEGKQVIGKGKIVPTRKGQDLQAAIEAGLAVGFSTRGRGETEEFDAPDGRKANRMTAFSLTTVDAVVDPSVLHARSLGYTREEMDQMENELREAREARATAEARASELEAQAAAAAQAHSEALAAATSRAEAAESRAAELESRVSELEAQIAEAAQAQAEVTYQNKLNALTSEHRFGATIRAKIEELRAAGIAVNAENVETFIAQFRGLVEAAGSGESASPRGDVQTEEDRTESTAPARRQLTPEQLEDLKAAGLD